MQVIPGQLGQQAMGTVEQGGADHRGRRYPDTLSEIRGVLAIAFEHFPAALVRGDDMGVTAGLLLERGRHDAVVRFKLRPAGLVVHQQPVGVDRGDILDPELLRHRGEVGRLIDKP